MVKLFTPEYKKQCVDMVLGGKHSVTQVCKMMRVSQSALNRWQRQFLAEQQGITPKVLRFLLNNGKFNVYGQKMSNYVAIMPY